MNASFEETLGRHLDAIARRDQDAFAATVAPHVRLVGTNGEQLLGGEAALQAHRDWFHSGPWTFEPEILWKRERGDVGWALARVRYDSPGGGTEFLLFLLFERGDDGWRLVYDQGTASAAVSAADARES